MVRMAGRENVMFRFPAPYFPHRRADSLGMLTYLYEYAQESCALAAWALASRQDPLAVAALVDAVAALRLRAERAAPLLGAVVARPAEFKATRTKIC
jgi:hypothetical protein